MARKAKMMQRRIAAFALIGGATMLAGAATAGDAGKKAPAARVIEMQVTDDGFVPADVKLKKGEPVELRVTRKTDETCAKVIVIPDAGVRKELPLGEAVAVHFTPTKSGSLKYGCGMGQMVGGVLVVQ